MQEALQVFVNPVELIVVLPYSMILSTVNSPICTMCFLASHWVAHESYVLYLISKSKTVIYNTIN